MDQDFEIYDGKNYSELVKNIVDNHKLLMDYHQPENDS